MTKEEKKEKDRLRRQENFIKKGKEKYGDKFDYSYVDYQDNLTKVKLICSTHGEIMVTPKRHLLLKGCPECNKADNSSIKEKFIQKSKERYGDQFDYSHVDYKDSRTKVKLICCFHGEIMVSPENHLLRKGCPKCNEENRLQVLRDLQKEGKGCWCAESRQKAQETNIERFGAKTWAESEIGRETARLACASEEARREMSERAKSPQAVKNYKETSLKNWGSEHWSKSEEGRKKMKEVFNTPEERLARSRRMLSPEVREKIEKTSMQRYGTPYYWQSEEGRKRLKVLLNDEDVIRRTKETNLERYGSESWSSSEIGKATLMSPEIARKRIETKKRNGTINDSQPERDLYKLLSDAFGKDDVECQYHSDRYPYKCDFYVKSLDLFIELNAYWMHGEHFFDKDNEDDLEILQAWLGKVDEGYASYERAVYVWTDNDIEKRDTAIKNNLNYVVFWDNDLSDAKKWLETKLPLKQF